MNIDDEDRIINVTLTQKDYETLRSLIQTQQSLSGVKAWIQNVILWGCGALLTLLGVLEYFKKIN